MSLTVVNTGTATNVAGWFSPYHSVTNSESIRRVYSRNRAKQESPPIPQLRVTSLDMLGYDPRVHAVHCPLETGS
jgi:hypothetical protein